MTQRTCLALLLVLGMAVGACRETSTSLKEVAAVSTDRGNFIRIKSESADLRKGTNTLVVEFQDRSGRLLAVEEATLSAVMPMPGMSPMTASIPLQPASEKGRFSGQVDFAMSGGWQFRAEARLPSGREQFSFNLNVR